MRDKERELRVPNQNFLVLRILYGIEILLFRVIFDPIFTDLSDIYISFLWFMKRILFIEKIDIIEKIDNE